MPDGRFLFGGRGGLSAEPGALQRQSVRIEAAFRRYYPAWKDVEITHRWSGFVCLAADLVPHIGAWEGEPGIHYAVAYHGNGVALASWAGRVAARLMATGENTAPEMLRTAAAAFSAAFLAPTLSSRRLSQVRTRGRARPLTERTGGLTSARHFVSRVTASGVATR